MKSLQVIASVVLYGLVLCASSGRTSALAVSAPLTISAASGVGVYLYNPASRTIACPLDYSNEIIMIPWQDYNISMQWDVYQDSATTNYYITAVTPSAAGCGSGTNAYWSATGGAVSTICSTSQTAGTAFAVTLGAKLTNYLFYAQSATGNSNSECVTIVAGFPTLPTSSCNGVIAATQWQFVTIG